MYGEKVLRNERGDVVGAEIEYDGVTVSERAEDGGATFVLRNGRQFSLDAGEIDELHRAIHSTVMRRVNGVFGRERKA